MTEEWRGLIYGGEDYSEWIEVSNLGRVRNPKTGTVRKQNLLKTGYYFATFSMGSRQSKKTFRVHKGLAEVFIPNPDNKPVVNHIDGNKENNGLDNLEWVTQGENLKHAFRTGLMEPQARLNLNQVDYIRSRHVSGDANFGARALARKFNVSPRTVLKVVNHKTYKVL